MGLLEEGLFCTGVVGVVWAGMSVMGCGALGLFCSGFHRRRVAVNHRRLVVPPLAQWAVLKGRSLVEESLVDKGRPWSEQDFSGLGWWGLCRNHCSVLRW